MLWCPNCKLEYRENFKTCSDCGADLVPKPEQTTEAKEPQYDHEAFLVSVGSQIEADMLEALLKENEIPVLMKYREAGDYLKIYMGGTNFGVDLYVPSHLLSAAQKVIEESRAAGEDFQDEEPGMDEGGQSDELSEPEEDDQYATDEEDGPNEITPADENAFNRKRRIRTWIILLFLVPGLLLAAILMIVDLCNRMFGG